MSAFLDVKQLGVAYGGITAATEVDLSLSRGEFVCMVGNNGAGKSSILSAIMNLVQKKAGTVMFDGKDITRMAPHDIVRSGITLVHENRLVFPEQSVRDNLILGAYTRWGANRQAVTREIDEVLDIFPNLKSRIHNQAGSLSGGEQQMLAVARGLLTNPKILLVDELSLGLAPKIVEQLFEILVKLNEKGMTILLVEQLAERALQLVSRAYVVREQHIIYSGSSTELMEGNRLYDLMMGK